MRPVLPIGQLSAARDKQRSPREAFRPQGTRGPPRSERLSRPTKYRIRLPEQELESITGGTHFVEIGNTLCRKAACLLFERRNYLRPGFSDVTSFRIKLLACLVGNGGEPLVHSLLKHRDRVNQVRSGRSFPFPHHREIIIRTYVRIVKDFETAATARETQRANGRSGTKRQYGAGTTHATPRPPTARWHRRDRRQSQRERRPRRRRGQSGRQRSQAARMPARLHPVSPSVDGLTAPGRR